MSSSSSLPPRQRPDRVKPRPPSPTDTHFPSSRTAPKPSTTATNSDSEDEGQTFHDARFPPDQESQLLSESHTLKAAANAQFAASNFSQAISTYDRALASCPNYLDYEIAVLQSNIAACHLRLQEWRQAIEAADLALEALDREDPPPKPKEKQQSEKGKPAKETLPPQKQTNDLDDSDSSSDDDFSHAHTHHPTPATAGPPPAVVELPSSDDEDSTAAALDKLNISDQRHQDIIRIRTKSLLRRARARMELGRHLAREGKGMFSSFPASTSSSTPSKSDPSESSGSPWTLLSAAQSDYTTLCQDSYITHLPPADRRQCQLALTQLTAEVDAAKQRETAEMMGKLKELGNGILRPFGLSTDMFKFVQDEKTGGYSVNFEQGDRK